MTNNNDSRRMWIFNTSTGCGEPPSAADIVPADEVFVPSPALPTVVQCLSGQMLTKTGPTGPGNSYEAGTTRDFNSSTGVPDANVTEWHAVRIILKTNGVAEFYRNKANNIYYKFANSGWTESNGVIEVSSVQFYGSGYLSMFFEAESQFAGLTVREAWSRSVGNGDIMNRRFTVLPSCSVPAFTKVNTY